MIFFLFFCIFFSSFALIDSSANIKWMWHPFSPIDIKYTQQEQSLVWFLLWLCTEYIHHGMPKDDLNVYGSSDSHLIFIDEVIEITPCSLSIFFHVLSFNRIGVFGKPFAFYSFICSFRQSGRERERKWKRDFFCRNRKVDIGTNDC